MFSTLCRYLDLQASISLHLENQCIEQSTLNDVGEFRDDQLQRHLEYQCIK